MTRPTGWWSTDAQGVGAEMREGTRQVSDATPAVAEPEAVSHSSPRAPRPEAVLVDAKVAGAIHPVPRHASFDPQDLERCLDLIETLARWKQELDGDAGAIKERTG